MSENKLKKDCRFFDRPEICKEIQKDCNCYQCDIAIKELLENSQDIRNREVNRLKEENYKLRNFLADKILDEIVEEEEVTENE